MTNGVLTIRKNRDERGANNALIVRFDILSLEGRLKENRRVLDALANRCEFTLPLLAECVLFDGDTINKEK